MRYEPGVDHGARDKMVGLTDDVDGAALERVGNVLNDKWTLERLLGVGGTAAVYAGCHRNGARAAIKVLHPALSRYKEVRERFQREGYAANKVGHPGVVKVLDDDVISSGPDEGTAYLVMELLEGESLQDRLERGPPVDERAFLEIAYEVLDVLQAAHERGVVHRDLKPENLFFAREAGSGALRVKVLDFGLARLISGQAITTYGLALGTPSFMSPEQAAGRLDEIDGRTDLFALATTGFRLRTGRRIHEAEGPVDLVRKMSQLPAPRLRSIAPDASAPYARVIDRALEFKREDRYESAAAMREDVKRAIAELDAGVHEPSVAPPKPPLPPRRRFAPMQATAPRAEATMELSERDLEQPPAYGVDESIRIPKTGSIWRWLALVLIGGASIALWRWAPTASSGSADVPGAPPIPSSDVTVDGGLAHTASNDAGRLLTGPPGTAPHRPKPAKIGPGTVRNPPRSN